MTTKSTWPYTEYVTAGDVHLNEADFRRMKACWAVCEGVPIGILEGADRRYFLNAMFGRFGGMPLPTQQWPGRTHESIGIGGELPELPEPYDLRFDKNEMQSYAIEAQAMARAKMLAELGAQGEEEIGPAYGIIDPDYARVYTQARIVAWQYGYACVMHGSFTRDLDLLLVPWTEQANDNGEQLLKLIAQGAGLRFSDGQEEVYKSNVDWSDKPHGRKSCSLYFPAFGDRRWVDISVVPRVANPQASEPAPSTAGAAVEPDFDPRTDCEKNYHECEDLKICGDCGRCMGA